MAPGQGSGRLARALLANEARGVDLESVLWHPDRGEGCNAACSWEWMRKAGKMPGLQSNSPKGVYILVPRTQLWVTEWRPFPRRDGEVQCQGSILVLT